MISIKKLLGLFVLTGITVGSSLAQSFENSISNFSEWMQTAEQFQMQVNVFFIKDGTRIHYYSIDIGKIGENRYTVDEEVTYLTNQKVFLSCDEKSKIIRTGNAQISSSDNSSVITESLPEPASTSKVVVIRKHGQLKFVLNSENPNSKYQNLSYLFNRNGRLLQVEYDLDANSNNGYEKVIMIYSYETNGELVRKMKMENFIKLSKHSVRLQKEYSEYKLYNSIEDVESEI